MTKRKWLALGTAFVIVVAAALSAAFVLRDDSTAPVADDNPTFVTTTTKKPLTTTTRKATTTTTADLSALSKPARPPQNAYAPVPIVQIGTIEIPKIGLVHPVFEGIELTVIDHGPGHWPGSSMPGKPGNSVFPGHRVTHSHPFLNLDLLTPGDDIIFHMPGYKAVYEVTGTTIVYPTDLWVTQQTSNPTVTLIACHPKHSAAQRIVVKGNLIRYKHLE